MVHAPRRRQPDTVRVATLDVAHSHRRSAVIVGPVRLPPTDELIARFTAMATVGPVTRVGLQPSTTSTRWRYSPDTVGDAVGTAVREPASDPVTLLTALRQQPGDGIRVLAAGDHLAIDFSHGLGEVPLLDMLIAVLLGSVDPADPDVWADYRHRIAPLPEAALRAIGLGPQRLWPLWRQYRRGAAAIPAGSATAGSDTSPPRPATHVGRIPADTVAELRRLRDSALPGVSMFALYTFALYQAFDDAGFDVDPTVTVPFDVRPYLPSGHSTLATFSAGLEFTLDRREGPRALHAEMTAAQRMARPVANLVVSTLKARAAIRAGHHRSQVPARPRLRLLHSNIGDVPRTGWSFSELAAARILVASDPADPSGMTVTTSSTAGALWLTAAYHDSLFDSRRVGAALDSVAEQVHSLICSR
ncbi:Uncharacterised protein [Mycolicibacterium vanbaalenii]|uniref:Acyltransferase PapA5 n=1 Tax=Mycolicibacterium vanbaalenii TaxID=110539 RepID=A0A5S9R947_MYCVN|nr:hypothetical protein [Mycolicibacterium vanbaalenii]CAA0133003.1 Uncharacterised protein [Mycolicibacterium vanbaalenii]